MAENSHVANTFLGLPDEPLRRHLKKYLSLRDLKTMRSVCSTTKSWAEDIFNFFDKCTFRITDTTNVEDLDLDERLTNLIVDASATEEIIKEFFEIYGFQIKDLTLNRNVDISLKSISFEKLPNLKILVFDGEWPIKEFVLSPSWSPIFNNITKLVFSATEFDEMTDEEKTIQLSQFLTAFRNLESLEISAASSLIQRQIIPYLASRLPNVFTDLNYDFHDFIEDIQMFPTISMLLDITDHIAYNLRGIEKNILNRGSFQNKFLTLVQRLGTNYEAAYPFPINELRNLEVLFLFMERTNLFELNDDAKALTKLSNLTFDLYKDTDMRQLQEVIQYFGFENNSVETLCVHFELRYPQECPNLTSTGLLLATHFKILKNLTIEGQFFPQWLNNLKNLQFLEVLTLINVELREEELIGENIGNPMLCQLAHLIKLIITPSCSTPDQHLAPESWWTDEIFKTVFSRMKLQKFLIEDSRYHVTKQGIKYLAEGIFASTIRDFPYHNYEYLMSSDESDESESQVAEVTSSEEDTFFSFQEFEKFSSEHFKLNQKPPENLYI